MNTVSSIIRQATRKANEQLNILTADTHERNQTFMAKTGHNFYSLQHPSFKKWNSSFSPVPDNYIIFDEKLGNFQIPHILDFDIVLSQNKFGQFQILSQIARAANLPLISLEHTLPMEMWTRNDRTSLRNMRGDINVFISNYSKTEWGFDDVPNSITINHGIDTDLFNPGNSERKQHILSVVNDWIGREYFCGFKTWQNVTNGLPVFPVGETAGFSQPAKDINELVSFYQTSQIFINTSKVSPIPMALLEAMSCGCMVISTATCMIPEIVQHGYNGLISNDEKELRKYLEKALHDKEMCKEMGDNARKTIVEKYGLSQYIENWNNVFYQAANININWR